MARHRCNKSANGADWSICSVCDGRIHLAGCTSKRDKHKDCCRQRHEMLAGQGVTVWRTDESQSMFDVDNKTWCE